MARYQESIVSAATCLLPFASLSSFCVFLCFLWLSLLLAPLRVGGMLRGWPELQAQVLDRSILLQDQRAQAIHFGRGQGHGRRVGLTPRHPQLFLQALVLSAERHEVLDL